MANLLGNFGTAAPAGAKKFGVFDDLMTYLAAAGSGAIAALYNGTSLIGYWGHDGTYRRPYGPLDFSSLGSSQTVFTAGTGKNLDPLSGALSYSSGVGLAAAGEIAFNLWDTIADWRYTIQADISLTWASPADGDLWHFGIRDSAGVVGTGGQLRAAGTIHAYAFYDDPATNSNTSWDGTGTPFGVRVHQDWRVAGTRRVTAQLFATVDWEGYANRATADCPADTDSALLTLGPVSTMSVYVSSLDLTI